MSTCNLCGETPPDAGILDHIRVAHPDFYGDGPERWPDGEIVVVDLTDYTADDIEGTQK